MIWVMFRSFWELYKIVFQIDWLEIRREVKTTTGGDQAFLMEIP